jgi:hypothetical protein
LRTAAYEVDDFQSVAGSEGFAGPLVALHDVAIEFDCDAVLLDAEFFNETGQGQGRLESAIFPIDYEIHGVIVASEKTGSK